jgi:hypothetical protein
MHVKLLKKKLLDHVVSKGRASNQKMKILINNQHVNNSIAN